jgi:hypothetical protein
VPISNTKLIYVDLNVFNNNTPIVIKQGDKNSRIISIVLTDNNAIFNVLPSYIIEINATKSNGETLTEPCEYSNNLITYTVSENFSNVIGKATCELTLTENDVGGDVSKDIIIHSSTFEVIVDKSTIN